MKYIGIFRQYNGNSCLCKRNCHYWKHLQGNWRSTIQGVKWVQLLQSKFLATENQFQNLWLIHLGVMIFKRKYQALVKVKNFAKSFLTIFRGLFWAVTNGQNSDIFSFSDQYHLMIHYHYRDWALKSEIECVAVYKCKPSSGTTVGFYNG